MRVELGGISLDRTEEDASGGIADARSVSSIVSSAGRLYVRFDIPGMQGSLFQDMGRTAVRLEIEGTITGKNALAAVEMLRSRFKGGNPVSFCSDISGASDITMVVIDDLRVSGVTGAKDRYEYRITLKEYHEPAGEAGG
jgi:hypothetical protein